MDNEELKKALMTRRPVIHNGYRGDIEYAFVSAIIYRIIDGKLAVSAELMDKNRRSVTIVRARDVSCVDKE